MTGHLVLSTLHTNDAPSAITRLLDLGVPSYLINSTVLGVLAQRLVRTLCPHCKEKTAVDEEEWNALVAPWKAAPPASINGPKGCLECRMTGYLGRSGIYEIMLLSPALKKLISASGDLALLREQAYKEGMKPLRISGAQKVAAGTTTIEEVLRVTPPPGLIVDQIIKVMLDLNFVRPSLPCPTISPRKPASTSSSTPITRWTGIRGVRKRSLLRAGRTSPSCCPSVIPPATGATSWRTNRSRIEATAALMNEHFVNIKVDREERPDLDQIYQTAHYMLTSARRRLAADHVPGTRTRRRSSAALISPRHARYNLPGFEELLPRVAAFYHEHAARILGEQKLVAARRLARQHAAAGRDRCLT